MTRRQAPQRNTRPTSRRAEVGGARRLATVAPALALLAMAAACTEFATTVTNKQPFEALPIYAEWWVATEACSGRTGSLAAISWFTATSIVRDDLVARGRWSPPHEIIIVDGFVEDELTVRHEMLHDLIGGDPDHEDPDWSACRLNPR